MACTWVPFHFEANQFFSQVASPEDWQRLRDAYPELTDDELLGAKSASYNGGRSEDDQRRKPNYGFRIEHDGQDTLRDFFARAGMVVPTGDGPFRQACVGADDPDQLDQCGEMGETIRCSVCGSREFYEETERDPPDYEVTARYWECRDCGHRED